METRAPGRGRTVSEEPIRFIDGYAVIERGRTAKSVLLQKPGDESGVWFPLSGLEESRPGWTLSKRWLLGALNDEQRQFFGLPAKQAV